MSSKIYKCKRTHKSVRLFLIESRHKHPISFTLTQQEIYLFLHLYTSFVHYSIENYLLQEINI